MLDKKDMENLKSLSDSQLRELITVIAQAAGADGRKAASLLSNTDSLRKSLENMSPAQADAFIRAAGVKHQLLQEVSQLADMQAEYQYHIKVNDKVGGEYRRISVEFNFVDAF